MDEESLVRRTLLNEEELEKTTRRIALEILERYPERPLALVGIYTRGVVFADRIHEILEESHPEVRLGSLDITLYRDDLDNLGTIPSVKSSDLPFPVEDTLIVLLDDVLFTGRTCRAAIDELMDYGRPAKIELGVLIDRGNRELPIAPDYTGRFVQTTRREYVNVRFRETDDEEAVYLLREPEDGEDSDRG